ncbi:hypothetical protein KM043_008558 [Ampulex compressa]|nr:hypothetical protein KM043_008558 [Ampulex compressa]
MILRRFFPLHFLALAIFWKSRWSSSSMMPIGAGLLLMLPETSHQWSLAGLGLWSNDVEETEDHPKRERKSSPRVLNFFPVPVEEECLSQDKRRRGICMNTYECRIQHGKSHGPCALGFGVCCIFTATCDEEVQNNLTYVTSPGFPNLIDWPMNCSVAVRKIDRQVSQLRIDFVHFNIGQPNGRTGICDEDIMEITSGRTTFRLCGWNSGQHVYIDMGEDDEPVTLDFRLPGGLQSRMWEMRVVQLGFEQRAPSGCLQYFRSPNGTLRTLNYLPNGRFLADQDYLLCVRQEKDMCGIAYTPCTRDSFRIGPSSTSTSPTNDTNDASSVANNTAAENATAGLDMVNEVEGSGTGAMDQDTPLTTLPSTNFSFQRRCRDRVLIPCDFEEFITPGNDGAGICNLEHCGDRLCDSNEIDEEGNCRVETWATPFRIRVSFGPGRDTGTTLEDNTGMCLVYEQMPCMA